MKESLWQWRVLMGDLATCGGARRSRCAQDRRRYAHEGQFAQEAEDVPTKREDVQGRRPKIENEGGRVAVRMVRMKGKICHVLAIKMGLPSPTFACTGHMISSM